MLVATQGRGDRKALEAAPATGAGCTAFVARRRKSAMLKLLLVKSGCDAARVNAVRAPAGLDIQALTPDEVAASILGEMIQLRRAQLPPAKPMALDEDGNVLVRVLSKASRGDPGGE